MVLRPAQQRGRHGPPDPASARRPLAAALFAAGALLTFAGAALAAPTVVQLAGWGGAASPRGMAETLPAPGVRAGQGSDLLEPTGRAGADIPPPPANEPVNGADFDLVIPSLGYRATVLEGTGKDVLDRAPGHYVTTPWPGDYGNVGVAGHNTYWLGFAQLKRGDRVELQSRRGLFVYEIRDIRVVDPDDRTVLAATDDHRLTLTTCYPLWAGAWATQRLVFSAVEIGGVA